MASFNFTRGCVYKVDQNGERGGSGSNMVQLEPSIQSDDDSPVILTGVQLNDQDLVLPVVTLDGFRIMYTFGEDFGSLNIVGMALLGAAGSNGTAIKNVQNWFTANRVSRKEDTISVSLGGGGSYEVYVTGLTIAEADTNFHIQPFVIVGRIAVAP